MKTLLSRFPLVLSELLYQHGFYNCCQYCQLPGRMRRIDYEEIVSKTTQEKPEHATHWSTRSIAQSLGISAPAFNDFAGVTD